MSTPKKPIKKMKLEDLQPKAPEYAYEPVKLDFWDTLKDTIHNDMPKVFIRLKEALVVIQYSSGFITDPEVISSINSQASNIVKDSETLMQQWNELKQSLENQIKDNMLPEEALAVSFNLQAEIEAWLSSALVLIDHPLDSLLDYCSSKMNKEENTETSEEKEND